MYVAVNAHSPLSLAVASGVLVGVNILAGMMGMLGTLGISGLSNFKYLTLFSLYDYNSVLLGANVTILPGVSIGDNCVIGAGSVVTKDIPENTIAVGNPCHVLRKITENDRLAMNAEYPHPL